MKRIAFLIESSEVPGEDILKGAQEDVKAYKDWIYSKPGGDWFDSEIKILNTPRISEVKRVIQAAGKIDYAFVAFSGHGCHSKELDLTKLCMRDGTMSVRELIPDTDRCTMVVDACRHVMPEVFTKSFQLSLNEARAYAKFAEARNYRQDFEDLVANAEKGTIFLYGCDLNESAGESERGGYFSRYLVEGGLAYARNRGGNRSYSTKTAFQVAAEATAARNKQQHPKYEPGRRLGHFPFGV
jgi:hypothetical protein